MRQRVMIAMAMACEPDLLVADEPTTALDVTVQAQVLDVLVDLKDEIGSAIMLITHDLGVIAEMVDSVVVMYLGRVVEEGPVDDIFHNPKHPYTQGLLASLPKINEDHEYLPTISGNVPSPFSQVQGCRFANRCPHAN
jgi:peptide/nickel transport system ATP-binding protein